MGALSYDSEIAASERKAKEQIVEDEEDPRKMEKKEEIPAELIMDCKSLYDAINSDTTIKDRRSAVAIATLRDTPADANIRFSWVPGLRNYADHLTKAGTNPQKLLDLLSGRTKLEVGCLATKERLQPDKQKLYSVSI